MGFIIMVPLGYLIGSLPFGLIIGKVFKRIDVREYGSGKMGMTNVWRTVGIPAAVLVLLLDMGKAVGAIALAMAFFDSPGVEAAAGVAALVGHNWPVFIGFRGGRGVASGWGGLFILHPIAGGAAAVIGLPVVALTRYMSLGSIIGASVGGGTLAALAALGYAPFPYLWYGVLGAVLVVGRHKDNIQRLLNGTERKLGHKAEAATQGAKAQA